MCHMSYESKPNHFHRNFQRTPVKSNQISPPPQWPPHSHFGPPPTVVQCSTLARTHCCLRKAGSIFTQLPHQASLHLLSYLITHICMCFLRCLDRCTMYTHTGCNCFAFSTMCFSRVYFYIRPPWCTPCLHREFF